MAEKFPTSTDEAQSSCSQNEMRDPETGDILRQQIFNQLENNYTSNDFLFMTASGSSLSVVSNSSTEIQTQITMSTCFSLEETSKMVDASKPDILQPANSFCNISDKFSYRESSQIDSCPFSDGSTSNDSAIFGSDHEPGMSSSFSHTSSFDTKDIKPKIPLPDFLDREDSRCLCTGRRCHKNKSKCEVIHRYFDSFDVNRVSAVEISPLKQPVTGGPDFSDFGDRYSKTESEVPVHISPKYPCSSTQISVSEDMNFGRDQNTLDNQIGGKTKSPNLTETRVSKRFRVDEALDSRKPKYSRLQTDQTTTLHNSSSDSCIQTETTTLRNSSSDSCIQTEIPLMGEDLPRKNSHLQDVDQKNKTVKSEENCSKNSDSHESFFRTL